MTTSSTSLSSTSLSGLGLSGLSSGLDTSGIITKLMAIESAPQTALQTKLSTLQTHTSALQSLNSAVAQVASSATTAAGYGALNSFTASSTSSAVTATVSSVSGVSGSLSFTVDRLAQNQVSVTDAMTDTSSFASSDHKITLNVNGTATLITAASSSVDDMVRAINSAAVGVSASKVAAGTANGTTQYRLQLSATGAGASGAFTVYQGDATPSSTTSSTQLGSSSTPAVTTVTVAQDAQLTLYPNTSAAQAVTSSSNVFTSLPMGISATVSAASQTAVTLSVASDATAATTSAQALTSGLITLFSAIASSTAVSTSSSTGGTTGGVFTGDTLVRTTKDNLLAAVSTPLTNPTTGQSMSPAAIGINLTKDGTITFDQSAFSAAMKADPAGTLSMYQSFATNVKAVASGASSPLSGTISMQIAAEQSQQTSISTQIDGWTTRLAQIQATYTAQFNNLETALNSLSSQASYLTSQISGLTTKYES